jgi:hypothetical protein
MNIAASENGFYDFLRFVQEPGTLSKKPDFSTSNQFSSTIVTILAQPRAQFISVPI